MQKISNWIATIVVMVVLSAMGTANAAFVQSYNDGAANHTQTWGTELNEVGWYYSPSQTITLTGVETRFGNLGPSGVTVTLEVFDAGVSAPFNPPAPIFTDTFSSAMDPTWSGVTGIVGGPQLDVGSTYFIGFSGVVGLGVNITNDGLADALAFQGDNDGTYTGGPLDPSMTQPILRISGDVVGVPEPASAAMLIAGTMMLVRCRRYRG